MVKFAVVSHLENPSSSSTGHSSSIQEPFESSRIPRNQPSLAQENEPSYLSTVRQQLQGLGFTTRLIEVITSSWRERTTSQYQTYLHKWLAFCRQQRCENLSPPIPMAVDFLTTLYERGSSYSTINTARSMLSSISQFTPIIHSVRTVTSCQVLHERNHGKESWTRPCPLPRHKSIWGVSLVFTHFRGQPLASQLSLKDLTVKLAFSIVQVSLLDSEVKRLNL